MPASLSNGEEQGALAAHAGICAGGDHSSLMRLDIEGTRIRKVLYLRPPISRRLSEISEILINARSSAAPSSIHNRTDLYGIFLVRPPLLTLARFLMAR